jgi:hypothetical protein
MLDRYFPLLLRITGALTALAGLQFFAPELVLRLQGVTVEGVGGLFFAQHWGMMVAAFGALMVWSASQPALMGPVVMAATVEKAALCVLVLTHWSEPALAGLHLAAIFDSMCVLLYAAWLGRTRRA